MPRRPNFKPFKRAGVFHVYSPLDGGVTDLKTSDLRTAEVKADALHRHYKAQEAKEGKMPKTKAESPKSRASAPKQPTAKSMVNTWLQSSSPASSPSVPESEPPSQLSSPATPAPSTSLETSSPVPSQPSTAARADALMPEDRRRRMADLFSKGVSRVVTLVVGVGVRYAFNRVPSPEVDPEDQKVLQEGCSLWMEEIFVDHPPRPWMVVGGAAVGIGIGMYVDGTPIERKPKLQPPTFPGAEEDAA